MENVGEPNNVVDMEEFKKFSRRVCVDCKTEFTVERKRGRPRVRCDSCTVAVSAKKGTRTRAKKETGLGSGTEIANTDITGSATEPTIDTDV